MRSTRRGTSMPRMGWWVIDVVGREVTVELKPHSPECRLLSPPGFTYDPNADTSKAEDLLTCMDEVDRRVWKQSAGLTLNPRKALECGLRLPLVIVHGSEVINGKDATKQHG